MIPPPWLALPQVLKLLVHDDSRGLESLMARHRALALQGQDCLLDCLGERPLASPELQAAMAALPLASVHQLDGAALQRQLKERGIQVPVIPLRPHRSETQQFLRISCFAYNSFSDIEALAAVLPEALRAARR